MKRNIRVSLVTGQLNLYLPEEAIATLGGMGSRVGAEAVRTPSGEIAVSVRRSGRYSLGVYNSGVLRSRVCLMALRDESPMAIADLPRFGPVDVSWQREDGGVSFLLPGEHSLPDPAVRRRQSPRRCPARAERAVQSSPHERLRVLLAELNVLLASGDVSDVRLEARSDALGESVVLTGPIVGTRTETFG